MKEAVKFDIMISPIKRKTPCDFDLINTEITQIDRMKYYISFAKYHGQPMQWSAKFQG